MSDILPDKTQALKVEKVFVKRWRLWIGEQSFRPVTMSLAAKWARNNMHGQRRTITLEPLLVEVKPRKKKS